MIEVAVNAYGSQNRVGFAGGAVNIEAARNQTIDNLLDLGVCGALLHHDDHGWVS